MAVCVDLAASRGGGQAVAGDIAAAPRLEAEDRDGGDQ